MIMSGVTAYEAERRAREEDGDTGDHEELFVETGGHLWGYANPHADAVTFHHIEHISVSAFAAREPGAIEEHAEEVGIKRQLMGLLHPELRLLGYFHSHPYGTAKEVKDVNGWEPSRTDRNLWLNHSDHFWESSVGSPVHLILAICPDAKAPTSQKYISGNTIQFGLGGFRFWLTAIVGDDRESRRLSRSRSATVALWPLPYQNIGGSGDSLRDYDPVQAAS